MTGLLVQWRHYSSTDLTWDSDWTIYSDDDVMINVFDFWVGLLLMTLARLKWRRQRETHNKEHDVILMKLTYLGNGLQHLSSDSMLDYLLVLLHIHAFPIYIPEPLAWLNLNFNPFELKPPPILTPNRQIKVGYRSLQTCPLIFIISLASLIGSYQAVNQRHVYPGGQSAASTRPRGTCLDPWQTSTYPLSLTPW